MGGEASGVSKRKKADLRKAMQQIMEMPATGKVSDLLAKMGYEESDRVNANAIAATIYSKAIMGDTKALEMMVNYFFQAAEEERKTKESYARIEALKTKGVDVTVNSDDGDDGGVVIYLPEIEKEEEKEE